MKKFTLSCVVLSILLSIIAFASAQQTFAPSPLSYYSGSISDYWPSYGKEECTARQDFIVQILPGGCSPAVVTSDLLEEQNVPIFCQLTGIKVNPLIQVPEITSITFKGKEMPKDIAGIGFHPARAALNTWGSQLLGSPVINNLGYLVVMLKQQPVEKNMSKWVETNLTAVIQYKAEQSFGIGKTSFVSTALSDEDWHQYFKQYSFWKGKGYVRVREIGSDDKGEYARVDIYLDESNILTSLLLREGQTYPQDIYLPGYYCAAALKVTLQTVTSDPQPKVRLNINGDDLWVSEGQRIIDDKCTVSKIEQDIYGSGQAQISCPELTQTISLNPAKAKLSFKVNGNEGEGAYAVKDVIDKNSGMFIAFIGDTGKAKSQAIKNIDKQFVVIARPVPQSAGGKLIMNDDYYNLITFKTRKLVEGDKFNGLSGFTPQTAIASFGNLFKGYIGLPKVDTNDDVLEIKDKFKEQLAEKLKSQFAGRLEFQVFLIGDDEAISSDKITGINGRVRFDGLESSYDKEYKSSIGKLMEDYYKNAIDEYKKIQNRYGSEKGDLETDEPYGVQALYQASELAAYLKKFNTQAELLTEIIEKYPNSKLADDAKTKLLTLKQNDMSNAVATIFVNGDSYNIVLEEVKDVSLDEKSVRLLVDNEEGTYAAGDIIKDNVIIKDIKENQIELEGSGISITKPVIKKGATAAVAYTLTENNNQTTKNIVIRVVEINLKKEARVLLTPLAERTETQANFTFKIGIEKRALKLSDEKAKELVTELDASISKWSKLTTDLGNLVKTWKTTCFVGSAYLWGKSFFSSLGGGSIARGMVMQGAGGWWEKCSKIVADDPKYSSKNTADVEKCLAEHNDNIEKEIDVIKKQIDPVNKKIEDTQKTTSGGPFNLGKITLTGDSKTAYAKALKSDCTEIIANKIGTLGKEESKLTAEDITKICDNLENSSAYYDDLKEIDLWSRVYNDAEATSELKEKAKNELYKTMNPLKKNIDANNARERILSTLPIEYKNKVGVRIVDFGTSTRTEAPVFKEEKGVILQDKEDFSYNSYASVIPTDIGYLYVTGDLSAGELIGNKAYHVEGKDEITGKLKLAELSADEKKITAGGFRIKQSSSNSCNNLYKNPEIKYHETEPYKGLAALVPLDKEKGWYAATEPAGAGIKAFDASGRVVSFWLCNVGENGLAEFFSSSDRGGDDCRQFYLDQTGNLPSFGCIDDNTKTADLVKNAQQALTRVSSSYKNGITSINLGGNLGNVKVTAAPVSNPGIECENFMSAKDCNTMFNLCDPVLCPSSRCNFGGRYAVPDVVQTGIIGGIMLCLPNFGTPSEGGVLVPVCLSGIHAGLENFVMILNATRDCLKEQIKTGRTVGICDEIQSVYLCEFFWKQAIPLMKIGIPQLLQSVFEGNKNKGGGEYMVVQESWNNLEQSINYFTNYYGVNAFKAFQARSTEEVGTEICNAFVSTTYPVTSDMFDKLTEPDSPTQFTAKFSEDLLTDATIPPTSHYKVYIWIYAGKDQGIYYNVYLKGQQSSSAYYQQLGEIQVPGAVGFVPKGEKIDKAVDFTAPSGYKELCVRINNQEKCGFTQVTTNFAVDELKNLYLEEEVGGEVTTEEQCVSGTSSLMPLLTANIQQGVEEAINPAIYKHGIIRICATNDPGKSTEPGRYIAVGYCGDKSIKCWLDSKSVSQSISDLGIAQEALDSAKKLTGKIDAEGYYSKEQSEQKLGEIKQEINSNDIIKKIDEIITKGNENDARSIETQIDALITPIIDKYREVITKSFINNDKAKANLEIAQLYEDITKKLYDKFFKPTEEAGSEQKLPENIKLDNILGLEETGLNEEIKITKINGIYVKGVGVKTGNEYCKDEEEDRWYKIEDCPWEEIDTSNFPEYYDINLDENDEGTNEINEGQSISILLDGKSHEIRLESLSVESGWFGLASTTNIDMRIDSNSLSFSATGTQKKDAVLQDMFTWTSISRDIDLNNDKKNDVTLTITSVSLVNKNIDVTLKKKIESKSFLENIKDFFVPEAEAAETISSSWIRPEYSPAEFANAQKESEYAERKSIYLIINQYAKQYNVNFNLIRAIIEKESDWNPKESTPTKETPGTAVGYMGLTNLAVEDMATGTCKNFCGFSVNKNNIDQNIKGGICYYVCQYDEFQDVNLALAAYNQGPTYVRNYCSSSINKCKNPAFSTKGDDSKYYVKRIIEIYENIITQQEIALEGGSKNKVIVIDPGHGGSDPGALNPYNNRLDEEDITLDIALRLEAILESKGYAVTLTRVADETVSLERRVEISNNAKGDGKAADLFISIHTNSYGSVPGAACPTTVNGTQVAYYRNTKSFTPQLARAVAESISATIGIRVRDDSGDGGAKPQSYEVLGKTNNAPGIYIETAFICNKKEESILTDSSEQEQIAAAISQSVSMYV